MSKPKTLPDFSILKAQLNQTNIQKTDPALYNILKNLIDANHQSQNTVINTSIPSAINNVTSQINNTITTDGTMKLNLITKVFNNNAIKNLNSSPAVIVPAPAVGLNTLPILVPIWISFRAHKLGNASGGWLNGNTSWWLAYSTNHLLPLHSTVGLGLGNNGQITSTDLYAMNMSTTTNAFNGLSSLDMVTQLDIGNQAAPTSNTQVIIQLLYTLLESVPGGFIG